MSETQIDTPGLHAAMVTALRSDQRYLTDSPEALATILTTVVQQHTDARLADATRTLTEIADLVEFYDNGDGECEPEDRARLFRALRTALTSAPQRAVSKTSP